jgi:hypothetical protein
MVSMGSSKPPQPDPGLVAQTLAAQTQQQQAVQSSLSADTLQMLRLFGQQNAMSGAGVTMPMTALTGGRAR